MSALRILKIFAKAATLLDSLPKEDAVEFQKFMKTKEGAKIQHCDQELKSLVRDPGMRQDDAVLKVLAEARVVEGKLLQATCVYVAMTLGSHPEMSSKCVQGAFQREALRNVVKEMEDLPAGVKQEIGPLFADRWAELKELAKTCTASGQEGVQSQQQQQQQQQ